MRDKGKPIEFVPQDPLAPSPWDDQIDSSAPYNQDKKTEKKTDDLSSRELPAGDLNSGLAAKESTNVQWDASEDVTRVDLKAPITIQGDKHVQTVEQSTKGHAQTQHFVPKRPTASKPSSGTDAFTPFVRGVTTLTLLILFECVALPEIDGSGHVIAPWSLWPNMKGVTFQASIFMFALFALPILPMRMISRLAMTLFVSATCLVFALVQMQTAIQDFGFRGHPYMAAVFDNGLSPLLLITMALLFPVTLYWRAVNPSSQWCRAGVTLAGLALLLPYLYFPDVNHSTGSMPLVALLSHLKSGHGYQADTISAVLLMLPVMIAPVAILMALSKAPKTGKANLWGWLCIISITTAPIVQSLFVASFGSGQWKYTLAPLKASLMLLGATLMFTVVLGHVISHLESSLSDNKGLGHNVSEPNPSEGRRK